MYQGETPVIASQVKKKKKKKKSDSLYTTRVTLWGKGLEREGEEKK